MYSESEGGFHSMSKILKVTPNDDYTLLVEFEHGNKIIFNMREIILGGEAVVDSGIEEQIIQLLRQ